MNRTTGRGASRWRWLLDDLVLISFAAFCLAAALGLRIWASGIEPTFISVFLGVAVAAITYRYLGGTDGAQFSVAALKLGGSAALLLAVTWWVGSAMTKERGLLTSETERTAQRHGFNVQIAALKKQGDADAAETKQLREALAKSDDALLQRIAKLEPDDPLIERLHRALGNPRMRDVARKQQVRIMNVGAVARPKSYWICRDSYQRFYPDQSRAGERLRVRVTGSDGTMRELDLRYDGEIDNKVCDDPGRVLDMHVSCDASATLFPELVSGCAGSIPRFARDGEKVFSAQAGVPVSIPD